MAKKSSFLSAITTAARAINKINNARIAEEKRRQRYALQQQKVKERESKVAAAGLQAEYIRKRMQVVISENNQLLQLLQDIRGVLKNRREGGFDIGKLRPVYIEPKFTLPTELTKIPAKPVLDSYLPKPPSFLSSLFNSARKSYDIKYEEGKVLFERATIAYENLIRERNERIDEVKNAFKSKCRDEKEEVIKCNQEIDKLISGYIDGKTECVCAYLEAGLEELSKLLPDGCCDFFDLEFDPSMSELKVDYLFPDISIIPEVSTYTYRKVTDEIIEKKRKKTEVKELYNKLLSDLSLRIVFEIFKNDKSEIVRTIKFNGYVEESAMNTTDKKRYDLVSAIITRERIKRLDLDDITITLSVGISGQAERSSNINGVKKTAAIKKSADGVSKEELKATDLLSPKTNSMSNAERLSQVIDVALPDSKMFASMYFLRTWEEYIHAKPEIKYGADVLLIIANAHHYLTVAERKKMVSQIIGRRNNLYSKIYTLLFNENLSVTTCYSAFMNFLNVEDGRQYSLPAVSDTVIQEPQVIEVSCLSERIDYKDESNATNYELPNSLRYGTKYKQLLELSTQEVLWLDKFYYYDNTFILIEGCRVVVILFYLGILKELQANFEQQGSSLAGAVNTFKSAITNKYGVKYTETIEEIIFSSIFKRAENSIREKYLFKRKLIDELMIYGVPQSNEAAVKNDFEILFGNKIDKIIQDGIKLINGPDDKTAIQLNALATTRWKEEMDVIINNASDDIKVGVSKLYELARLNEKNPSIENIFYEAAKNIARHDKKEALKFYLHYVYHDLNSAKIDKKELPKNTLRALFRNADEERKFQNIVNELRTSKNIDVAILGVDEVYEKQRKKILLDVNLVNEVKAQHADTVSILSGYLDDEVIAKGNAKLASEENSFAVISYLPNLKLDDNETELLGLFNERSLLLTDSEIGDVAKRKGIFKGKLLNSINEKCYDLLDDVLIESDEESYYINPDYYKKILKDE